MGFLDVVAGLRKELGVDASLSVSAAVNHMSELMGLPTMVGPNNPVVLPVQVEALCECLNFSLPLAGAAAADEPEVNTHAEWEPALSEPEDECGEPIADAEKVLKQREFLHPLCLQSSSAVLATFAFTP